MSSDRFRGWNLRQSVRYWEKVLHGTVAPMRASGEFIFRHTSLSRPIRVNGRRKDTPRKLSMIIRRLARELPDQSP